VIGCERSLGLFDTATRSWDEFCVGVDEDVDNTIINDGMAYSDNLIFGTKDLEFATKKAGLYLYRGSDQRLIRLRDDQICSNGKAILIGDAGDLRLLDIDSPTRQLVSYPIDIAAGSLGVAEVVLDFAGDPAVPDGAILTPDQTGIIVSMFRPEVAEHGETRLYDLSTGQLLCTWQTPGSPQNTCPALVRHEGSLRLVITTAAENMSPADQQKCPNAGRLFLGEVDIQDQGGPLVVPYPR
jgi:sugar lactone lactonase YvrE